LFPLLRPTGNQGNHIPAPAVAETGGSSKKEYKEFKEYEEYKDRSKEPESKSGSWLLAFLLELLELLVLLVLLLSWTLLSESLAAVGERNFS
jgi:hypothetical protein